MSFHHGVIEKASFEERINEVICQPIDRQRKSSLVQLIKDTSFVESGKATSLQTIFSVSTTMVGTSTIVFPVLYHQVGIGTALVISCVIAALNCKTTQLLMVHNKTDELDIPDSIYRVLGRRGQALFSISNIILLWASGMIYMILIISQLYPILEQIVQLCGGQTAPMNEISYTMISYQWVGVVYALLILPLLLLKQIGTLLKLIQYGTISVVTFILFTIYKGSLNLINHKQQVLENMVWVTYDVTTLAGVFSLAFLIQCFIVPVMKNNQHQKNNSRDIKYGYIWTWFVYQAVGIFGAFAVSGVSSRSGTDGSTLLDFFEGGDITVLIVQILLFLQLTSVFPVLQFIVRSQLFGLIYGLDKPPEWQFNGFTLFYIITCLVVQNANINLSLMISLVGAVVGLVLEYIIPIALHLTCLYRSSSQVQDSKKGSNVQNTIYDSSNSNLIENIEPVMNDGQTQNRNQNHSCNEHMTLKKRRSKQQRIFIYSLLMIIGFLIMIGKLTDLILAK